jgi:hypothetical protein
MDEEGLLASGRLHLVAVLQSLDSIVAAVLSHHGLHLTSSHRIAACPELDGVENDRVNEEADTTHDGLEDKAYDTIDILVAGHVALPLLILVEEAE